MHIIRLGLAALFCVCVGAAGAQESPAAPGTSHIVLQLSDLEFDAYSLDPLGGTAAAGLLGQQYRAAAKVTGTREEFSREYVGTRPVGAHAIGDSSRMDNPAASLSIGIPIPAARTTLSMRVPSCVIR